MKKTLKASLLIFGICGISRLMIAMAWGVFSLDLFSELPQFFRYYINVAVLVAFAAVITSGIGAWIENKA